MKKQPAMKAVKKRNGKFMVRKRGGGLVKGADKAKFLVEAGLVKKLKPKAKAEGDAAPAQ